MAETPEARRQAIVEAVIDARQHDAAVTVLADRADGSSVAVEYADRSLRLEVDAAARERLDEVLAEYHVFKLAQPATRRADDGVVVLSAVTDPKHLADFVEALFRTCYELGPAYTLDVERPASDGR